MNGVSSYSGICYPGMSFKKHFYIKTVFITFIENNCVFLVNSMKNTIRKIMQKREKITMKNTLNYKWSGKVGYLQPSQVNVFTTSFINEITSI